LTATATLTNNILGQSGVTSVSDFLGVGAHFEGSNNLISNNDNNGFIFGTLFGYNDPLLLPLASNGGPNKTMALKPNRPAFSSGVSANYPGTATPITTDQKGDPRHATPSIGAFDLLQAYFVVETTLEEGSFGPEINGLELTGGGGTQSNPNQAPVLAAAMV